MRAVLAGVIRFEIDGLPDSFGLNHISATIG
ncbi:hypothetical protein BpOF4_16715 [Alkalihalophilus pseudofirmus OF4]|uniref:Uncharacterized protein n=1 Tax=Alkalihalophilus pseudofirmus (strain ATCC BAA-2126 / JCM 17055 / OF4) TaxID=398511 RepID=D3FQL6_ALKPO|nr:hypothetical protein BpOF4_16715 [Alkalihalophilus pseudofirmus OF4]